MSVAICSEHVCGCIMALFLKLEAPEFLLWQSAISEKCLLSSIVAGRIGIEQPGLALQPSKSTEDISWREREEIQLVHSASTGL